MPPPVKAIPAGTRTHTASGWRKRSIFRPAQSGMWPWSRSISSSKSALSLMPDQGPWLRIVPLLVFQLRLDLEACLGLFLDFIDGHAGCEFGQRHVAALLVDAEHTEIGDDHVHYSGTGQRQF